MLSNDGSRPKISPEKIAISKADIVLANPDLQVSEEEERTIAELDAVSEVYGLFVSYFVESGLAMAIPAIREEAGELTFTRFDEGLVFEGQFAMHSIIKVGQLVDQEDSVRALCLTFSEATMLPYLDRIRDTDLLHVPVLAVETMTYMPD